VQIIHRGQMVLKDTIAGLEQQMLASSILMTTSRPGDTGRLTAVDGVQSVETIGENQLRIFHHKERNPAEQLAAIAVAEGWGLLELIPERRSMEQIFIEITQHTLHQEGSHA
jgi:ABC-2 type transport system ATP-binding protein